jgi:hypothetical protein
MIHPAMAKRKKARQLTTGQHRRFRFQRIVFTMFAVIIVASFLISLVV